ncbi:hypothetical protein PR048_019573 [Dryococelus australis]|uniref:Uncharacterized protein n=1 Tax=Dryococelus australis TaxID=614101 RepID=A0ABQ9H3V3_9NEOP|nr:hypothetical protein PR048_019573 [Dryococelus australis]
MPGECKSNLSQISTKARAMKVARRQKVFPQAELHRLKLAERQATCTVNDTQEQMQAQQEEQAGYLAL